MEEFMDLLCQFVSLINYGYHEILKKQLNPFLCQKVGQYYRKDLVNISLLSVSASSFLLEIKGCSLHFV